MREVGSSEIDIPNGLFDAEIKFLRIFSFATSHMPLHHSFLFISLNLLDKSTLFQSKITIASPTNISSDKRTELYVLRKNGADFPLELYGGTYMIQLYSNTTGLLLVCIWVIYVKIYNIFFIKPWVVFYLDMIGSSIERDQQH